MNMIRRELVLPKKGSILLGKLLQFPTFIDELLTEAGIDPTKAQKEIAIDAETGMDVLVFYEEKRLPPSHYIRDDRLERITMFMEDGRM
jgi:hypothetical protein